MQLSRNHLLQKYFYNSSVYSVCMTFGLIQSISMILPASVEPNFQCLECLLPNSKGHGYSHPFLLSMCIRNCTTVYKLGQYALNTYCLSWRTSLNWFQDRLVRATSTFHLISAETSQEEINFTKEQLRAYCPIVYTVNCTLFSAKLNEWCCERGLGCALISIGQ